jgi:hypothetical protein
VRRRDYFGVGGEAQVVVGAEIEDRLSGGDGDPAALGRGEDAFAFVKSGPFNLVEQGANVVGEPWVNHVGTMTRNGGEGKSGVIPAGRSIRDRPDAKAGREHEFL